MTDGIISSCATEKGIEIEEKRPPLKGKPPCEVCVSASESRL